MNLNLARTGKLGLSSKNEFDEVIEKLLDCLPPYADVKFFVDIMQMHYCFEDNRSTKPDLIILGTGIPEELIYASGATPYWILGGSRTLSIYADDSVPRDTDPVSRAMLGCLQNDRINFPKNTLILVPLVNDSSRKLAYILKAKGYCVQPVFIPPTQGKDSEKELCRQSGICVDAIHRYTGKKITKRNLQEAQNKIEKARKQIQHFMQITNGKPELLPSIWRLLILHSYYCAVDLEVWSHHLSMLNYQLMKINIEKRTDRASSVLLLGSPIYFPNYKIPFLLHDVKLNIIAHLDYTLEKFLQSYHVDKSITIEQLMCSFYKKDCSSAYAENRSLYETVSRTLAQMQIDGVVYHVLKGQIEYDFELERLEELFSAHSIPICRLETDYNYQDIEQLRIRIEAFSEVLNQRKYKKGTVVI